MTPHPDLKLSLRSNPCGCTWFVEQAQMADGRWSTVSVCWQRCEAHQPQPQERWNE